LINIGNIKALATEPPVNP